MSYAIVWEFIVPGNVATTFEAAYGPEGDWARLFGRAAGFVGVELLRCAAVEGRYLTVDRWVSAEAFDGFKRELAAAYESLDAQLEGLATTETYVGSLQVA